MLLEKIFGDDIESDANQKIIRTYTAWMGVSQVKSNDAYSGMRLEETYTDRGSQSDWGKDDCPPVYVKITVEEFPVYNKPDPKDYASAAEYVLDMLDFENAQLVCGVKPIEPLPLDTVINTDESVENTNRWNLSQIKSAFWITFHKQGELYFDDLSDEQSNENCIAGFWSELVENLNSLKPIKK